MISPAISGKTGWILIVLLVFSLTGIATAATGSGTLIVVVKDSRNRDALNSAQVYLDGGYRGTTAASDRGSSLTIQDVSAGKHTVRVTSTGYKEVTRRFEYPAESTVEVTLSKGALVSLNPDGPKDGALNIIFYPSSTAYSCTDQAKISSPEYIDDESRFREDVEKVILHTYTNLNKYTDSSNPLPSDMNREFNFYYYYDPANPADAFDGCAGSVPEQYWKEVPFGDVTVILYPSYRGIYGSSACQPTGCFQNSGTGRNVMKAPADQLMLIKHETGHAIFELVDTYCGTTYYYQNDPYPNVWASLEACKADALSKGRDAGQCRQIQKKSGNSVSCTQNFWQWDPVPDIMASGYSGKFGGAATARINYVLSRTGAGS